MVNKCILLKKGKTIRFMVSIVSILEAMKFILVLCLALTLFIGCGEPNLDDPKVREKVLAEAIDEDSLQIRHTPSGEELLYAPNQEQPDTGWVRINQGLMHLQDGELHGIYLRWHNNQQNLGKGTYKKVLKRVYGPHGMRTGRKGVKETIRTARKRVYGFYGMRTGRKRVKETIRTARKRDHGPYGTTINKNR